MKPLHIGVELQNSIAISELLTGNDQLSESAGTFLKVNLPNGRGYFSYCWIACCFGNHGSEIVPPLSFGIILGSGEVDS